MVGYRENKHKRLHIHYCFLLFCVCFLALVCIQNCVFLEYNLTEDISSEILYMVKVWETKDPFTPAFANSAEPLFSRPWFFFIFFYSITNNALLSEKCTLIVTTICLAAAIGTLLKKVFIEKTYIYVGLAAYFGLIANGSYTVSDMLFRYCNTYSMYHIGLMITLTVLIDNESKLSKKIWKMFFAGAISFCLGLCGYKALMLIYLPIFLADLISVISFKLEQKQGQDKGTLVASGGLIFINFCAIIAYNLIIVPHMMDSSASLRLVSSQDMFDNISKSILALLNAFGFNPKGENLFSPSSVLCLYMIALMVLNIIVGFCLSKQDYISGKAKKIVRYAILSIGITLLVCSMSSYASEPRYYLYVPLLTTFIVTITYKYLSERPDILVFLSLYCVFIFIGFGLGLQYEYSLCHLDNSTGYTMLYTQLCEENVKRLASLYTYGTSSISLLSNGEITGICISDDERLSPHEWISDRTVYSNSNNDDGPFALLLSCEDSERWLATEKRGHLLSLASEVVSLSPNTVLYKFQKNYLAFDMLKYNACAKYNFMSLSFTGNAYLDRGSIVLEKAGAQYGPYSYLQPGSYNVVIRGKNLASGSFDVFAYDHTLQIMDLETEQSEVRFSFSVEESLLAVEYRCVNNTNEPVIIQDILVYPNDTEPVWDH